MWEIKVLPGPNAEPDYFTADDIKTFYSTVWKVHYNSNRLGIRLQGPRPQFARPDGGEGGSHPSNVHDHVYAIGTINFTGAALTYVLELHASVKILSVFHSVQHMAQCQCLVCVVLRMLCRAKVRSMPTSSCMVNMASGKVTHQSMLPLPFPCQQE